MVFIVDGNGFVGGVDGGDGEVVVEVLFEDLNWC